MALDTYAGLLSGLATFSVRSDQTTLWPLCVSLAEAQMNRDLADKAVRPMIARAEATIDEEFESAPVDMIRPVSFSITDPVVHLQHVAPENVARMKENPDAYVGTDECGNEWTGPRWYAHVGAEFQFFPAPEASYTGDLTYVQRIPSIIGGDSNWVLEKHSRVYLYGALRQFAATTQDERLGVWSDAYAEALEAMRQAYPTETNKVQLRTEFPFPRCW